MNYNEITIECPHCDGKGKIPRNKTKTDICHLCDGRKIATEKEIDALNE